MKIAHPFVILFIVSVTCALWVSCSSCQSQKNSAAQVGIPYLKISPDFDADSAYFFVKQQVLFGPRVPGSMEHRACGDYLVAKLREFGAYVVEQKADVTHYNGQNIEIRNIIGSYRPEEEKRILLFAHWDSRPFADEESDAENRIRPISGADDGASGVGILLEIARHLQAVPPDYGIDIIFFDLEDWGQPSFDKSIVSGEWWCVGSRYWSENPHIPDYKAEYGILLDMVGAADAVFPKEGNSVRYASNIVEKVWRKAVQLGYTAYFPNQTAGYITDDHIPINENHRAPSIDIIHQKNTSTGFAPHWHTHNDNMSVINRNTLLAVGQTVLEVIYSEKQQ